MNVEVMIENYRKEFRRRRDTELRGRMSVPRTSEEMLFLLSSLRGLNGKAERSAEKRVSCAG